MMSDKKILITDTSVLINFLKIDRVNLLNLYPGKFVITDQVAAEITDTFPEQKKMLENAIAAEIFEVYIINDFSELKLFAELTLDNRLGAGECSAIACAIHRGFALVIDDIRAKKQALKMKPDLEIITTRDIIVELIRLNTINIQEAEKIKDEWKSKCRFSLNPETFSDIL